MTSLNHVGLFVRDLSTSVKFYKDLFNFPVIREFSSSGAKIAVIDVGGEKIELIQRPDPLRTNPIGVWGHIALYVADFDRILELIDSMGLDKRMVTTSDGSRLCFFSDPDGHTLELTEKGL
jgi:catechol 2,3-dioxygenase-like lactoylglutathione lyase family enzyme